MAILLSQGNYFGVEEKVNENSFFKLNITHYQPHVNIKEHYHENAYLSLLINGSYREIDKKDKKIIESGEIIFRPAGYNHANHFLDSGGSCLNIEFKNEALRQQELKSVFPGIATTYKVGAFEYLYKLLYCFVNDLDAGLSEEYIFSWLTEKGNYKMPSRLVWLPKVKAILENEFEAHHTIRSLSERVYVHPVYLARAFKEREGLTPGEYQLKMRVKRSMELLFRTDLSISEIAYTAGFSDAAHLIKSFKLFYPVSPHKFRLALKS